MNPDSKLFSFNSTLGFGGTITYGISSYVLFSLSILESLLEL
jgi:hypothetical protein